MDILNPNKSIYDILAEKRAQLELQRPDIAAQLPSIAGNTPGERMHQTAQQQPAQDLASMLQQATAPLIQGSVGPNAKPKEVQQSVDAARRVTAPLDPSQPLETYGPNWGKALGMGDNAGGILGLGIQPIDVLAFTIFAGLTSNMPQDQAMKMTMWGAGLPRAFRENQESKAKEWVQQQLNIGQLAMQGENLAQRQLENAQKARAIDQKNKIFGMMESDIMTQGKLSPTTKQVVAYLGKDVVDPSLLKALQSADIPTQLAAYEAIKAQYGDNVSTTIEAEGGQRITISGDRPSRSHDVSQRTREIIAAAAEQGRNLSIADARAQALSEEIQLAGGKAGAIAQATPPPAEVQKQIVTRETVSSALAQVRENFDAKFVGPVAGRFFDARRQGLDPRGAPGEKEVYFRLALNDASDLILRARSGAQINENEAARLTKLLPKPTDKPDVFMAALNRFEGEFNKAIDMTKSMAQTPKSALGAPPARAPQARELPPPPKGWSY